MERMPRSPSEPERAEPEPAEAPADEPAEASGRVAPARLRRRVIAGVRGDRGRWQRITDWRPAPARARVVVAAAVLTLIAAAVVIAVSISSSVSPRTPGNGQLRSSISGVRASLVRTGASAELTLSNMPQPPLHDVYEVWTVGRRAGTAHSTNSLFAPTKSGRATVEVPGGLRGVKEVMLTEEPTGGSSTPTGPAVLRIRVPAT